jgi:hypothetical protein
MDVLLVTWHVDPEPIEAGTRVAPTRRCRMGLAVRGTRNQRFHYQYQVTDGMEAVASSSSGPSMGHSISFAHTEKAVGRFAHSTQLS